MFYKNKFFPKVLGEVKLGIYYVSPTISLRIDEDYKTIWLDLDTKSSMFAKKEKGLYNYPIVRKSYETNEDFSFLINDKFKEIFDYLLSLNMNIPTMLDIILNPIKLGQEHQDLINFIQEFTNSLSKSEKNYLKQFSKFILNLSKISIHKALNEENFTKIFGNLTEDEEIKNNVGTEKKIHMKKQNITKSDIEKCFGDIILSDNVFYEIITALGLDDINADPPRLPKSGGAIFIDQGGTGKSLMKSALECFWKNVLGGEVLEKEGISEFTEGVNYAELIRSWYRGSSKTDGNYEKEGLFKAAIRKKVPSLLIIDEATRFVSPYDKFGNKDNAAFSIINEFKSMLTERKKGGFNGYVLTVFIANVDREELDGPLSQGGERLTTIYFGPPRAKSEWLSLINLAFEKHKINFKNNINEGKNLVAELLLFHNQLIKIEKFMISPRKFEASFCANYKTRFLNNDDSFVGNTIAEKMYNKLQSKRNGNNDEITLIKLNDFLNHLIEDLLLIEVDAMNGNINEFRRLYFEFINNSEMREEFIRTQNNQTNNSNSTTNNSQNSNDENITDVEVIEKIPLKNQNYINNLKSSLIKNKDDLVSLSSQITQNNNINNNNKSQIITPILTSLDYIESNFEEYLTLSNNNQLPATYDKNQFKRLIDLIKADLNSLNFNEKEDKEFLFKLVHRFLKYINPYLN